MSAEPRRYPELGEIVAALNEGRVEIKRLDGGDSAPATRGPGRPGRGRYGKGILSASTLAGSFGYTGGLIQWAKRTFYDGALEGKTFEELDTRDTDIGSLVHAIIEAEVHGDEWPVIPEDYEAPVQSAYAAWQKWMKGWGMEVVATEVPLVSQEHRLGGTIDAILRDGDGRLAIGDWKTSKKLRSSYLVQLAIYGLIWDANNDEKITGGYHLLRFSKTDDDLDHRHFSALDDAKEQALRLREAYDADARLQKRVSQ